MDFFTLLGVIAAVSAVLGGHYLEGGEIAQLLNGPAALIVLGGSIAAAAVQTPRKDFVNSVKFGFSVFSHSNKDFSSALDQLVALCTLAHRKGVLALEKQLSAVNDPFIVSGLRLVIDGYDLDNIRASLELEMISQENKKCRAARVYDAMGGYAPTLGIIGAVLGLIHVLSNMSDPELLGAGIATAFVATIYGVGIANLLFIPVANKVKAEAEQHYQYQEMIMEGILLIADGKSPYVLKTRLQGYLH